MSDPSFNVLHRRLRLGRPVGRPPAEDASGKSTVGGSPGREADPLLEALPFGALVLDAARAVSAVNDRLCALLAVDRAFFTPGEPFAALARRASLNGESCLVGLGTLLDDGPRRGDVPHCAIVTAAGTALTVRSFPRADGRLVLGFTGPEGAGDTDSVRAEAERNRLRALLDKVVENIPHVVTVRDARDLSYCLLNRAAEAYLGAPRETLLGKPRGRIFGTGDSDALWAATNRIVETGEPLEMPEIEVETATHGRRILRGRKFPIFDEHGKVEYVLTITDDLTGRREREKALRRSEQRLREAIESFTDGLALFDAEDRLVLCNSRYRDMWPGIAELAHPGTSYAELVRAVVLSDGLDRRVQDIDAYVAARVNRHRNPPATAEHGMTNGRWLNVTHRATAEGGVSVTCTDITALKEREERLRHAGHEAVRAKEAAEAANRSKSDFLANMSHELRTPLNAVIGFSEIIKDAMLGEHRLDDYREYARDIHESGRHLLALINDILDMSKIEAGKLELFEETLDIAEVIDPCLKLVRDRATRSDVELKTVMPDGLPRLRGDIRKMKQILINLLTNAVKFTPAGGSVTVSARVEPDGAFVLRVADTGPGIRPEDIERALEPFSQIESGPARSHEGTGLGLALTKALIELHGGRLQIDTRCDAPPTGTTVSVTLPARRVIGRTPGQA